MSKFSVSLPDLRECAKQVEGCRDTYEDLVTALRPHNFDTNLDAAAHLSRRLGKGFDKTASNLGDTVDEYKEQEEKALEELESADPGSEEAKKTADSIDHGEANSDWSGKVVVADLLPEDYVPFNYRNRSSSYYDEMTDQERIVGTAIEEVGVKLAPIITTLMDIAVELLATRRPKKLTDILETIAGLVAEGELCSSAYNRWPPFPRQINE